MHPANWVVGRVGTLRRAVGILSILYWFLLAAFPDRLPTAFFLAYSSSHCCIALGVRLVRSCILCTGSWEGWERSAARWE